MHEKPQIIDFRILLHSDSIFRTFIESFFKGFEEIITTVVKHLFSNINIVIIWKVVLALY